MYRARSDYNRAYAHWGRDRATAAVRARVGFGFARLNLHRIEATTNLDNTGSMRVLAKVGFTEEGILRDTVYWREVGAFYDAPVRALAPGVRRVSGNSSDRVAKPMRRTGDEMGQGAPARWERSPNHVRYLNNSVEQDHRGIKQRYYPMRGFGNFDPAARFCRAYDEQRHYFRSRTKQKEQVSLTEQRRLFRPGYAALQDLLMAA